MLNRWLGPLVALLIVGGVAAILLTNLETGGSRPPAGPGQGQGNEPAARAPAPAPRPPRVITSQSGAPFREYPIGDEVERDGMRIAAVWLPSVEVDGQTVRVGSDVIHLEADVHATEGNPNGFGKDEFVPYLKVSYRIDPESGGPPLEGALLPMVAADGPHYGASVSLPRPGRYRLTYRFEPPSAGGMGRHTDPMTGVAAWWRPFQAAFDWDYPGPQGAGAGSP